MGQRGFILPNSPGSKPTSRAPLSPNIEMLSCVSFPAIKAQRASQVGHHPKAGQGFRNGAKEARCLEHFLSSPSAAACWALKASAIVVWATLQLRGCTKRCYDNDVTSSKPSRRPACEIGLSVGWTNRAELR
jgi:hypothetical protein